jgi:transposase InsO family protein
MASQFEPLLFDDPKDWFIRMEAAHALLEASSGNTVSLKTFLLATMGAKASSLVTDLLAPKSVQDKAIDYESIKKTLLSHLQSQHLEIAERCNFYAASQGPNESAADFYSRLKKLSEFCNFDTSLDTMLRDRMVLGCRSIEARRRLLQIDPLDLKTVQDTLAVFEAIEGARGGALQDTSELHSICRKQPRPKPQHKPKRCYRCGREACRFDSTCPAMGKTCSNCGKPNHFKVVCRSKANPGKGGFPVHHSEPMLHVEAMPVHNAQTRMILRLNDHSCVMELDTGAAATIISAKMWRAMGSPNLSVSNRLFSAYDGHRMKPLGELADCRIEKDGVSVLCSVTVVESAKQYGLLGRDVLDNFLVTPLATNHVETRLPPMKVEPVSIDIADESKLRFSKARPVPLPLLDSINKELQRLEDKGVIKPVSSSRWASPVVWVKKRDGSLRMCADFKVHVNRSITSDAYPLPNIETMFAGMRDSTVYAKLDLRDAYWQIPLDARSREVCTINTSKGLYQMLRLPKGMKNSSAIFQRVIEVILKDIPGVLVYQDDVLLHAPTTDALARRLSAVLNRLDEKDVTINRSKSILNSTEVKFLGHLISSDGIRPDPDIAKKILSCKPPQSKPELESFLGLVNFFGRMIPNFSRIVQPLHYLRKKNVTFEWTDEHNGAFTRLLQLMSEEPVLVSYDLSQPAVTLATDASEKAIGAVLLQGDRPVIFVSRILTGAEQRYSNIEREALAVVWSVYRLKQLLLGRHFTLRTDHKPLEKIYGNSRIPKVASNRLVRWSILLQQFDFDIKYQPGSQMAHADALTRLRLLSDNSQEEDLVINNVAPDISSDWTLAIQQATTADELAQAIIQRVKADNWKRLLPSERAFFRARQQLSHEDGLLLLAGRCYIPLPLRKDVFNSCHQLHTGIHSTTSRIKLTSWWPTLGKDVRLWIRSCPTCSKLRPSFSKQLNSWPVCSPFERIHADWCHIPDIGNLLVIVDAASGWIETSLPQQRTTTNVIDSLSAVFSRFGVPKYIVTDNGAEFISREFNHFCSVNGITKMESPPYHPQSNGAAERGVQTIKNGIKAWRLDVAHVPFKEYLKRLLLHHRACFRRPDGRTPAEIVFGRNIRVPLSRDFFFSQPVHLKGKGGTLQDASFLLERGSNTSWVLDSKSRLRLAHRSQLAERPASTPVSSPSVRPYTLRLLRTIQIPMRLYRWTSIY